MKSAWKRTVAAMLFATAGAGVDDARSGENGTGWIVFSWVAVVLIGVLGYWLLDMWESDIRRDEREAFKEELKRARLRE